MIWSIVLAAGQGQRFGQLIPKQYSPLAGRRLLDYSIESAAVVSDGIVIAVDAAHLQEISNEFLVGSPSLGQGRVKSVVPGGASRSASVRSALSVVPDQATIVLVHDAARPLATAELFRSVIRAVRSGADGAVPGLPVVDTLKRVVANRITETVDRIDLVGVQTPQGFGAEVLRAAHASGADATDDAGLVERIGGEVVVVPGESDNLKITVEADLTLAAAYLGMRASQGGSVSNSTLVQGMPDGPIP